MFAGRDKAARAWGFWGFGGIWGDKMGGYRGLWGTVVGFILSSKGPFMDWEGSLAPRGFEV